MQKPQKWTEVYPQGTKEGNEEGQFFKVLARHPQWQYRTTAHLAAETGLTRKRIEEIISKYTNAKNYNPPLVYAHPTQEDHWGYWERVPEHLEKDKRSITKKDQDRRVKKHISGMDIMEVDEDLGDLPDDIGCDGACDLDTVNLNCNTYAYATHGIKLTGSSGHKIELIDEETYQKKKRHPMGIGKIGLPDFCFGRKFPNKYTKMKSAYGVSCTLKDDSILKDFPPSEIIDPNVKITDKDLSQPACDKRWKRTEIQSSAGADMIMKDEIKDCGKWKTLEERWLPPTSDEDGWIPTRPKESKPIEYPNIYGFKTPQKHAFTTSDGPPKVNVTWTETIVSKDHWDDVKAGYNVQTDVLPPWNTENYNGWGTSNYLGHDLEEFDDEVRWTVTEDVSANNIRDIPEGGNKIRDIPFSENIYPLEGYDKAPEDSGIKLPEIPEIPQIIILDVDLSEEAKKIEFPPMIWSTPAIDPKTMITQDKVDVDFFKNEIQRDYGLDTTINDDGWELDI